MLNIFTNFRTIIDEALNAIAEQNNLVIAAKDLQNFSVEPAKDKDHGDLACNAALVLSKKFSSIESLNNPHKLAQKIIEEISNQKSACALKEYTAIKKLEIAGAGFINIFLENKIFWQIIGDLLQNEKFIFPNLGHGEKINLEYASPNPTGPIHVGHTRGAIYGDVLATLLQKVGYDVLKEYYINDAGAQIDNLVKSAYLRYLEACGEKIEIPSDLYPGEYLITVGENIKNKFGETLKSKSESQYIEIIRDFVVEEMLKIIKADLLALGIKHDSYFSEKKNLHDSGKVEAAIKILRDKDLIYVGKLEAPKTEKGVGAKDFKMPEGYDDKDQTLFASTKFGDDCDRVIKKADGTPTYLAGDMAYCLSKFERGFKKFIMPLGFDHAGYVKRLNAVVASLTNNQAQLKVILCQMVKFVKNGEPVKMSKRSGNFITAREVIDEVGADALRFIMLTRKNDAPFDFDLAKVIDQSKDNPIFYVQYAHARCASVLRQFVASNFVLPPAIDEKVLENLCDESEIEIIKKIASFPRIIEMSATSFEPHRLAFYLQELAAQFHALWNKGTENPDLKFIIKDNLQLTLARIYLVLALKKIIKTGLEIFNINAVEEMR
ncbi:MAG: arginine--tRNA ligase [Rickettsiales bacterium]|nr:arginine--tRNA ligase [Rickettsiales bacterium]